MIITGLLFYGRPKLSVFYAHIFYYGQEGKLFFYDLPEDVIQDDFISRLISFPNVLITANQGFFTREAMEQIAPLRSVSELIIDITL